MRSLVVVVLEISRPHLKNTVMVPGKDLLECPDRDLVSEANVVAESVRFFLDLEKRAQYLSERMM